MATLSAGHLFTDIAQGAIPALLPFLISENHLSYAAASALVGLLLSGPVLAIVFAALTGAATIATFAVTIVMGQEFLPGRLGVSAGVTIGLSIGLGGAGAPLLGILADTSGLRSVFEALAVLPILALGLVFALPRGAPVQAPASRARGNAGRPLTGVR